MPAKERAAESFEYDKIVSHWGNDPVDIHALLK